MSNLTEKEIEAYVAEYALLADKTKDIRVFLNKVGLITDEELLGNFNYFSSNAQKVFKLLFNIKYKGHS